MLAPGLRRVGLPLVDKDTRHVTVGGVGNDLPLAVPVDVVGNNVVRVAVRLRVDDVRRSGTLQSYF